MTGLFKRLRKDERGAALVEFAFVLTPLMLFILGGLDLGYQAYLRAAVQGALNDVARTGSLESPTFTCTSGTVEEKIACAIKARSDVLARNATYQITTRSFYDFGSIGKSEKLVTDHNLNGTYDPGDCFVDLNENGAFNTSAGRTTIGGADDVVFYEVNVSMPRLFPIHRFIDMSPNYAIKATSAVRNQPYAVQKTPPTVCV
ncbi:TadE/TadG family type IV pilus assembly protein [Qipengyuania qiaonensis]|uniref:Pilus assembly protein n=1 Tax=Qipengyuania qiaonensis TaxID=2867240 RepID=A0ABS7J7W9_9SPHN|nr:TadE family protein [Qipengyuania qiaonensis]MBX7481077.1 pilus assembly protein [Qipengyuania qiaonensis]